MVRALPVADDVTAEQTIPAPRVKRGIPHLPGLDGLRGLAVLGVVFFHAGGLLPGGYLGVDLFFVLSGYLITSILLAEQRDTGRIDLAHFWVRRARRLFPALLSLMPAIALYALLVAKRDELATLRGDALATLGYVANWRAVFSDKSYWALFAAPSPLEHTWSLAIEEQFYVLWPLLFTLVLVVLHRGRRAMLGVTLVLLALSVAAMLWVYDPDATSRAYFRTDTRAAAILAGAALALTFSPAADLGAKLGVVRVRALDVLGLLALGGVGCAWLTLDGQSPFLYHGGFWLTEIACLALIACAVCGPASLVARALASRPLAYVGTISYGVYLWHWPVDCVLTLERTHLREPWLEIARLALTLGVSIASYRYFERPIRTRGLTFARARFVVPSAFAGAALVVVWATAPRPVRPPVPTPPAVASTGSRWPTPFSVDSHVLPVASELPPGTLRILTLGDSVAAKLGLALRYRQESAHTFVAERGVGNCSILESQIIHAGHAAGQPGAGGGCAARWASDVAEVKPDVTLIVLGGAYLAKITRNGKNEYACDAGWQDAYRARLEELLGAMGKDAGRVVLTLVPYPLGRWRGKGTLDHVDCFNKLLASIAAAHALPTVDVARHVCPTRDCIIFSEGEPIRPDGLHPDGKGAEETARWTLAEIRRQVR